MPNKIKEARLVYRCTRCGVQFEGMNGPHDLLRAMVTTMLAQGVDQISADPAAWGPAASSLEPISKFKFHTCKNDLNLVGIGMLVGFDIKEGA